MANNRIQIKRTSVTGRAANTTTLTQPGELALNMTDGIMYSTNGSVVFEVGANLTSIAVGNTSNKFTANTTGAYHTGTVNAASHTVGSSFIANSVGITTTGYANVSTTLAAGNTSITGFVNATASVNSAILAVGTSFIANTTGAYHTGTVNAASFTAGFYASFSANATLVNAAALNVVNQVNTATLYAATSANIASAVQANSTGLWTTGTVNGSIVSVGTSFVANTTRVVIGTSTGLQANGGIGTSGQFLTSNGTTAYWSTPASAQQNTYTYTLAANATLITGADDATATLSYTAGLESVFINGVRQISGVDYNTTNSTAITLTANAIAGEVVQVVAWTGTIVSTSVNVNAQYVWTNTHSFSNTVTFSKAISANGTTGTAGQYLTSNGTAVYWSTSSGSFSNGTAYTWTANQTFNQQIVMAGAGSNGYLQFGPGGFTASPGLTISTDGFYLTDGTNSPSINALAISIGSAVLDKLNVNYGKLEANSSSVNITAPLTVNNATLTISNTNLVANGSSGTSGQVLTSNGSTGSPYWATPSGGGGGGSGMVLIANGNINSLSGYPKYIDFGATLYSKYILFLENMIVTGMGSEYFQPNTASGAVYSGWIGTATTTIAENGSNTATVYGTSIYNSPNPPAPSAPQGVPIMGTPWNPNISATMGYFNGSGYIVFEAMNSATSPFGSFYPAAVGEFTYKANYSAPFTGDGMASDKISLRMDNSLSSNVTGLILQNISNGWYSLYGVPQ